MISESPELHRAIYSALCACLGLSPSSDEAAALIIIRKVLIVVAGALLFPASG